MPNKLKKDNIRLGIEKEWPSAKAFGTILPNYMITPDSTFTRLKTGAGAIEYFNEPYINYGSEDNPNIILNPNGNIPTLLYSPLNNSLDDVKLDLLHHYREYDPAYLDLLQDYTSTLDKGEILWNSLLGDLFRNRYPNTYNKHWKEWDALVNNTPDNSLYMVLGIDGSLRNLLAKEETIKKSNYAPREEAILQYLNTPKAQQAFNNIQLYLESNRLPEVIVTPNSHADGGSLKTPLDWNELSMKEKAAYIRMGVANGYKNIDDIRLVYNEFQKGGYLYGGGGTKKSNTPPQEYIYDVLPRMLREAGLNIKVTSDYRKPGAVGTAGSRSWHPRHGAVDIVPMGKTTFEDIEEVLHTNPTIVKYMLDNGFGLLDESGRSLASKDTMKRTGATGAHFHIGRDSKPALAYRQRVASIPQTATTDNRRVYFSNPFLPIPEDTPKQVVSIQTPAKPLLNTTLDSNVDDNVLSNQLQKIAANYTLPEVTVIPEEPKPILINPLVMLDLVNSMMVPLQSVEVPKPLTATERLALINEERNSFLLKELEDNIIRNNKLGIYDNDRLRRDAEDLRFYRNIAANGGNLFGEGGDTESLTPSRVFVHSENTDNYNIPGFEKVIQKEKVKTDRTLSSKNDTYRNVVYYRSKEHPGKLLTYDLAANIAREKGNLQGLEVGIMGHRTHIKDNSEGYIPVKAKGTRLKAYLDYTTGEYYLVDNKTKLIIASSSDEKVLENPLLWTNYHTGLNGDSNLAKDSFENNRGARITAVNRLAEQNLELNGPLHYVSTKDGELIPVGNLTDKQFTEGINNAKEAAANVILQANPASLFNHAIMGGTKLLFDPNYTGEEYIEGFNLNHMNLPVGLILGVGDLFEVEDPTLRFASNFINPLSVASTAANSSMEDMAFNLGKGKTTLIKVANSTKGVFSRQTKPQYQLYSNGAYPRGNHRFGVSNGSYQGGRNALYTGTNIPVGGSHLETLPWPGQPYYNLGEIELNPILFNSEATPYDREFENVEYPEPYTVEYEPQGYNPYIEWKIQNGLEGNPYGGGIVYDISLTPTVNVNYSNEDVNKKRSQGRTGNTNPTYIKSKLNKTKNTDTSNKHAFGGSFTKFANRFDIGGTTYIAQNPLLDEVVVTAPKKYIARYDEDGNPVYTIDSNLSMSAEVPLTQKELDRQQALIDIKNRPKGQLTGTADVASKVAQMGIGAALAPLAATPLVEGIAPALEGARNTVSPYVSPYIQGALKFGLSPISSITEGISSYAPLITSYTSKALPYIQAAEKTGWGLSGAMGLYNNARDLINGDKHWANALAEGALEGMMMTELSPAVKEGISYMSPAKFTLTPEWKASIEKQFGKELAELIIQRVSSPEFLRDFFGFMNMPTALKKAEKFALIRKLHSKIGGNPEEGFALLGGSPSIGIEGSISRKGAIPHDLDYMAYINNASKDANTSLSQAFLENRFSLDNIRKSPILDVLRVATGDDVNVYKIPSLFRHNRNLYRKAHSLFHGKNNLYMSPMFNYEPGVGLNKVILGKLEGIPVDFFMSESPLSEGDVSGIASSSIPLKWKLVFNKRRAAVGLSPRDKDIKDVLNFEPYSLSNPLITESGGQWSPFSFGNTLMEGNAPSIFPVETYPGSGEFIPTAMNFKGKFMPVGKPFKAENADWSKLFENPEHSGVSSSVITDPNDVSFVLKQSRQGYTLEELNDILAKNKLLNKYSFIQPTEYVESIVGTDGKYYPIWRQGKVTPYGREAIFGPNGKVLQGEALEALRAKSNEIVEAIRQLAQQQGLQLLDGRILTPDGLILDFGEFHNVGITPDGKPVIFDGLLNTATKMQATPTITAEDAASITPEVTLFYHGSPVRFDAFSADFIGSGEGGSKVMKGINLWPKEKIANAPKFANIKSNDAPLHLGVSSTPLGGELNPTVYDVSGKGLKLYRATPREIKSLNQEDLIKQGYDGVQTTNQVTVFPESLNKLSIDKQSSIKDFVMNHPEVERWTPWTTDNQKMQNIIDMSKMSKWTPEQWTAAQDAAIARGDMAEVQRLRDLHFKVSAPDTKIINEKGNPLHLYHGTKNKFNVFDESLYGNTDGGMYGTGVYTTPYRGYAENYGDNIMDLYANVSNPVDARNLSIDDLMLGKLEEGNNIFRWTDIGGKRDGVLGKNHYLNTKYPYEVISHKPSKIKSADAVTYDDNGVRIPLGKRDNFNINDIRYSWLPWLLGGSTAYSLYKK